MNNISCYSWKEGGIGLTQVSLQEIDEGCEEKVQF